MRLVRPLSAIIAVAMLAMSAISLPPASAQDGGPPDSNHLDVRRLAGPTRVHTAVEVSRASHPDGADVAVLARADTYGDALVAAPLATALDAPVLLTSPTALDDAVAAELDRLAVQRVVVIGALDRTVTDAISTSTELLSGTDPWDTYALVAAEVQRLTGATQGILVEGANADPDRGWPDALAASALAAARGLPIFMTEADALPGATARALAAADLEALMVVGGTVAVSEAVAGTAAGLAGSTERIAGAGRYETAAAIARLGLDERGYATQVWVASGRSWPDALVAGPAVARAGGVLVLSDPGSLRGAPATHAFIEAQRGFARAATLIGGEAALSAAVAETVRTGILDADPTAPTPSAPPVDPERPAPRPALNTAPPISAAVPWSDPDTWGGQLPRAGDVVTIPADTAVLLDVDPPVLEGIRVDGTLVAADMPLTVQASWIVVTGHLALGTETAPLTSPVTVVLDPQPGADVVGAGAGPIAVQGGTLDIHGVTPAHTWTRLASTAPAGASTLTLEEAPGWSVGDLVVIASTSTAVDEAEERTVTRIDGTTVTLDRPLSHVHRGQVETYGRAQVAQQAEVASLTRNVVVTSTDAAIAARRGGHVQVFPGSVARISGAEFTGMGQEGVLARYPIHFHLMDSASGSYVRGASVHHAFNRCITIHGTHHLDIVETIGYETIGHCFFFEDGVETANTLFCNLGLSTRAPAEGLALLPSDETPATFWVTNPTNHLVENAAAGSEGHGFWYDLPERPMGDSSGVDLDIRRLPFGTFDGNVAHTGPDQGWQRSIGIFVEDYFPPTTAVMRDNTAWKQASFGVWAEGVELHDTVLAENGIGFLGQRATLRHASVVGTTTNGDGEPFWRMVGVGFYHQASTIEDVEFVNFAAPRVSWARPGRALEFIADEHNGTSEVVGARFINANRFRMVQPDEDGQPDARSAMVRDVDGSISGRPATLASNHPLLTDPSCAWDPDLRANVCGAGLGTTWIRLTQDETSLGPVSLTRPDGTSAPLDGPRWAEGESSGDIRLNQTYRLGQVHDGHLEWVLTGREEGWVELVIDWPYPQAHVYDGWGRWHAIPAGTPLASGGWSLTGGTLTVRHLLDDIAEDGTWQRVELCAQAYCGNPGPG